MPATPAQLEIADWLAEQFAKGLASVLEAMAGSASGTSAKRLSEGPGAVPKDVVRWSQTFSTLPGEVHLIGSTEDALYIGNLVMLGAGIEDSSPEELKSTFMEVTGQVFSVAARGMTSRLGREITPAKGQETQDAPGDSIWYSIQLTADRAAALLVGMTPAFLDALTPEPKPIAQAAAAGAVSASPPAGAQNSRATGSSQTFDLLLDVELPVSVSFGHAEVPLKDVLKLTTGSIVELSRAIVEPVDVVVNNCVIARGEVVVVEGNFGVRIQQVISRSDRLRTLQ